MLKKGTEQRIRNQWSSAEKERVFQVSGFIGIDTKPVVGSVSGWVQVGINFVVDGLRHGETSPFFLKESKKDSRPLCIDL